MFRSASTNSSSVWPRSDSKTAPDGQHAQPTACKLRRCSRVALSPIARCAGEYLHSLTNCLNYHFRQSGCFPVPGGPCKIAMSRRKPRKPNCILLRWVRHRQKLDCFRRIKKRGSRSPSSISRSREAELVRCSAVPMADNCRWRVDSSGERSSLSRLASGHESTAT